MPFIWQLIESLVVGGVSRPSRITVGPCDAADQR
jgi:hypothetical protein